MKYSNGDNKLQRAAERIGKQQTMEKLQYLTVITVLVGIVLVLYVYLHSPLESRDVTIDVNKSKGHPNWLTWAQITTACTMFKIALCHLLVTPSLCHQQQPYLFCIEHDHHAPLDLIMYRVSQSETWHFRRGHPHKPSATGPRRVRGHPQHGAPRHATARHGAHHSASQHCVLHPNRKLS